MNGRQAKKLRREAHRVAHSLARQAIRRNTRVRVKLWARLWLKVLRAASRLGFAPSRRHVQWITRKGTTFEVSR